MKKEGLVEDDEDDENKLKKTDPEKEQNSDEELEKSPERDQEKKKEPSHFSRVDVPTLHSKAPSNDFPLLSNVVRTTFTLKAGEMLYLPAGWFHEVTSFNDNSRADPEFSGHLAFNYWLSPPVTKDFGAPYDNEYWVQWWKNETSFPVLSEDGSEENENEKNEGENEDKEGEENENEKNESENEDNENEDSENEEKSRKGGKRKRASDEGEETPAKKKSKK